jgi:hypothetical protein
MMEWNGGEKAQEAKKAESAGTTREKVRESRVDGADVLAVEWAKEAVRSSKKGTRGGVEWVRWLGGCGDEGAEVRRKRRGLVEN